MTETELRNSIVKLAKSLFDRGYTVGSSGNISVRCGENFLVTPTNSCMGFLEADTLSLVSAESTLLAGNKPTKELSMHFAVYTGRPQTQAVVHLHSTYATLLSCLDDTDASDALLPITPYAVMRLGKVPVLPYTRPGSDKIVAPLIDALKEHSAVLLANHGPVVSGSSLEAAVYAAEELEETAKLLMLSRSQPKRLLSKAQVAELDVTFNLRD